jgi:drug/metabolite transporter (DMT)-like permease
VNYLHLVWASILGWLVFDHAPDGLSLLGIFMIAGAGMAVAVQTQLAKRALV